MLFTDITDSEMLIFRYIQRANGPVSMVEVMDAMNEQYETDWKRSTVCTFLTHLVEKGYIKMERKGRDRSEERELLQLPQAYPWNHKGL